MATRRRLPVIQSAPPKEASGGPQNGGDEQDDEERPPWHWVGFGTVAIFAAWLPLTYAAQAVIARVLASRFGAAASPQEIAMRVNEMTAGERARLMAFLALPTIVSLALSSFAGGYLVGRFGKNTTVREAGTAGAMVALLALVLSLSGAAAPGGSAALATAIVTAAVAVGFAALGGRAGVRRRGKNESA